MNKFLKTWRMMLQKSGATACKILNNTIEQARILRWLLLLFFAMPHIKRYKKYRLADLLSMTYPQVWNIPLATLCFVSRWQPQLSPLSASHPRRPRRDCAAFCGPGRPCRRGRAADLCGGHGGRGQQIPPWPWWFSSCFGSGRWWKGFVHNFRFALGCWVVTCC